jgi:hypothetical protein
MRDKVSTEASKFMICGFGNKHKEFLPVPLQQPFATLA